MMYSPTTQTGFSLVETLVAITILLIVVVGPMTIAANATKSTNFSSEQVIAFFLAQEGAELAQKARDDLLLPEFSGATCGTDNCAWNEFYTNAGANDDYVPCFDSAGCGLAVDTDAAGTVLVESCSTLSDCRLQFDDTAGVRSRYNYTTGDDTIYTRVVTMTQSADRDIQVVSTVTWRTGNQQFEQSAEVVTYLYNVYGR